MNLLEILRIIRSANIGPVGFRYLYNQCNGQNMIEYMNELNFKWNGRSIQLKEEQEIREEIEKTHALGYSYILFDDINYSEFLRKCYEISPVLIAKGNQDLLKAPIVGVVGMRNASANGISFTKQICRSMVNNDFVVCSGGAIGIDTAAHLGSMPQTICVLPGGPDNLYPLENKTLFEDISMNGLLITEISVNSHIIKASFLKRNKLIAALSNVVCIMESGENSGALYTAKAALDYGKKVLAVPGHPSDFRYEGNNHLVKKYHAKLLTSIEDIHEAYFEKSNVFKEDIQIKKIDHHIVNRVYEKISIAPIYIDELCNITHLTISEVMSAIGELLVVNKVSFDHMLVCRMVQPK